MNTKLHNRILSALLAMLLFLSCLPAPGVLAQGEQEQFAITYEGEALTEISFPRNEKRRISADNLPEGYEYQWQIRMPQEETWVDIMGQEGQTLVLSYALLKNMMDDSGNAAVRCAAVEEGEMIAYTEPLRAFVTAPVQPADPEPPVEETTEPTEETTEEPTEATEETTEPTEETTEATEETTEPTEETTEATEETTESTEETTEPTEATTEATEETFEATEASTEATGETGGETLMANLLSLLTLRVSAEEITEATEAAGETTPEGQAEETSIVTATIQYLYEDRMTQQLGDPVWDPFSVSIQSGTSYSATVANKVVPAYQAVLLANPDAPEGATAELITDPATGTTSVKLTLNGLTENVTFTVAYREIQVPYKARYFLQNINNDLYTEDTTIPEDQRTFYGYKGDSPSKDALEKPITGFTSLFHQPDFISADGSTVFEIYYDRNYYLINFDLDGGFGTAPVYARYQTTFHVSQPEKPGYVFQGWKLIKRDDETVTGSQVIQTLPTTIPAENQTYQAVWKKGDASYTIVYWKENVTSTGYEHWGSRTVNAISGDVVSAVDDIPETITKYKDPAENNYEVDERLFFNFNSEKSDKNVLVLGDNSTVVNVYYDRNIYTLKFYFAMTRHPTNADTTDYIYVIGGSTWHFGHNGTTKVQDVDEDSELSLLTYYNTNQKGQRGTVTEIPALNDRGNLNRYTRGVDTVYNVYDANDGTYNYKYHYISFTAKYGTNIKNMWPCDAFDSATRADPTNNNKWDNDQAFVSAWNGEYNVWYSQNKGNPTVKGKYEILDYKLLWQGKNPDDMTVTYLCFWENGANITWSVPEMWYYRQWATPLPEEDLTGKETKTVDDITYKLLDEYPTCDDSDMDSQTQVTLTGFSAGIDRQRLDDNVVDKQRGKLENMPESRPVLIKFYRNRLPDKTDAEIETYLEENYIRFYVVDFYYNRNTYKLEYYNRNGVLADETKQLPYQTSLDSNYSFTPPYPSGLEKDAYTFQGWYTTPHFDPNTRFTFTNEKMGAADMTLYAKWAPITHSVKFYLDYNDYEAGTLYGEEVKDIPHGTVMTTPSFNLVPTHTNSNYRFVKWFYIEDGKKVAFEPTAMTVQKDLKLYAEWTSSITAKYTIYYVKGTEDSNGNITYDKNNPVFVADPTVGYAFQATTKSFKAKPEEELNRLTQEEKDKGIWLPNTSSHSILMGPNETAESNTYTFVYVTKQEMPYTVKHVDITTGAVLKSETVSDNKKSVVTEQFEYFPGYVADDFHKTLILSADPQENVITFYYTKTETPPEGGGTGSGQPGNSLYKVVHYIQDLDENGQPLETYSEYTSNSYVAQILSTVTAEYLNIPGYRPDYRNVNEYNQVFGVVKSGEDDEDNKALILELYYNRLSYDYKVRYVERGTNIVLIADTDTDEPTNPYYGTVLGGKAYFGHKVTITAPAIKGYDLYTSNPQSLTISSDETRNVIIFEYVQKTVTIYYEAVCTQDWAVDFGIPSQSKETPKDTGTMSGAQAIPKSGFQFVGWYRDEACADKIEGDNWFADGNRKHLKPQISFTDEIYEYTYYALFEPITLTISQTGLDANESAIYQISNNNGFTMLVEIQGGNSVTLEQIPAGSYTVTELTDWTWKNGGTANSQNVTVTENGNNQVTFTYTEPSPDWLGGEESQNNKFSGQDNS